MPFHPKYITNTVTGYAIPDTASGASVSGARLRRGRSPQYVVSLARTSAPRPESVTVGGS